MRALDFLLIAASLGCLSRVSSFCIENTGNEAIYVRATLPVDYCGTWSDMGKIAYTFGGSDMDGIRIQPQGSTVSDWMEWPVYIYVVPATVQWPRTPPSNKC
jgi:hypothetical protein